MLFSLKASTYPSSMVFLLNRPNASVNKKAIISKTTILVRNPLHCIIPSMIRSKILFMFFLSYTKKAILYEVSVKKVLRMCVENISLAYKNICGGQIAMIK